MLDRLPNFYFILQVDLNKMTVTEGLGFSDEEAKEVIYFQSNFSHGLNTVGI